MTKFKNFANKVALVTGGSSGIGLATARLLAQRGANVWVISSHQEKLESALQVIQAACVDPGQRCGVVAADVSDNSQVEKAVAQVSQSAGAPDLLVNSAGVCQPGYTQELDLSLFRWMMDVNYFGTLQVTKALLPAMIARRSGYIVNISSMAGFVGLFGYTAYGASKFAVRGFSEALRAEMKLYNIGVSIVYPPDTDTPQLAYEKQFKPVETQALTGASGMLTADAVAGEILKGIGRGQYAILPGLESKLIYRVGGWIGDGIHPIIDRIVSQAKNKNSKG